MRSHSIAALMMALLTVIVVGAITMPASVMAKPKSLRQMPANQWVSIDWELSSDANVQALYQHMATLLNNVVAVPADRANYYASFINNIGSWGGMINDVRGDGQGGYIITMSVDGFIDPVQLENDQTGQLPLILVSNYSEIYHVDAADNVTYIGPSIPTGWPSQLPFTAM